MFLLYLFFLEAFFLHNYYLKKYNVLALLTYTYTLHFTIKIFLSLFALCLPYGRHNICLPYGRLMNICGKGIYRRRDHQLNV